MDTKAIRKSIVAEIKRLNRALKALGEAPAPKSPKIKEAKLGILFPKRKPGRPRKDQSAEVAQA